MRARCNRPAALERHQLAKDKAFINRQDGGEEAPHRGKGVPKKVVAHPGANTAATPKLAAAEKHKGPPLSASAAPTGNLITDGTEAVYEVAQGRPTRASVRKRDNSVRLGSSGFLVHANISGKSNRLAAPNPGFFRAFLQVTLADVTRVTSGGPSAPSLLTPCRNKHSIPTP